MRLHAAERPGWLVSTQGGFFSKIQWCHSEDRGLPPAPAPGDLPGGNLLALSLSPIKPSFWVMFDLNFWHLATQSIRFFFLLLLLLLLFLLFLFSFLFFLGWSKIQGRVMVAANKRRFEAFQRSLGKNTSLKFCAKKARRVRGHHY